VFFIVVSITERRMAKRLAPASLLNCPDTFALTFTFLMARSDALLSGGTFGWYRKVRMLSLFFISRLLNARSFLWEAE
jgi:hypothetical protein